MNAIKRIVNIVTYVAKAAQAIAAGCQATLDAWPSDSPFNNDDKVPSNEQES